MHKTNQIAVHLPYLRRFARSLTGSQAAGDAYVVATLEAVSVESKTLAKDLELNAALYKVLLTIWGSVPANRHHHQPGFADTTAKQAADVETITPLPRVCFLLHTVEGFSSDIIAKLVDRPTALVRTLIEEAEKEIATQHRADVLIIEDEAIISMDLEGLVEELGHNVIGIARTRTEAMALATKHKPGLIMADIQLADGSSGLDAVSDILAATEVPVVFITAYPQRLLTGERPEPTFLITKPFQNDVVKAVISQALFFDQRARLGRKMAVPAN
ncbi:response regulator [Acidisoma cladoniae]|uniref:response regulator n=1 Tax=Acidisoma cladoniae TaxID=3040935 RepID=UPI00254A35FD|nr:response regulator [Acidisoma sp. PAMC 29798]